MQLEIIFKSLHLKIGMIAGNNYKINELKFTS